MTPNSRMIIDKVKMCFLSCFITFLFFASAPQSKGAGISVHILAANIAVDHIKNSEPELFDILNDNRPYLNAGVTLPDAGYYYNFPFAEIMHNDRFIYHYFDHIALKCNNKWESEECRILLSHFMGLASHGYFDNLYDKNILEQSKVFDAETYEHFLAERDSVVDRYALYDNNNLYGSIPLPISPLPDILKVLKDNYANINNNNNYNHFTRFQNNQQDLRFNLEDLKGSEITTSYALTIERNFVNFITNIFDSMLYPWLRKNYVTATGGIETSSQAIANFWMYFWRRIKIIKAHNNNPTCGGVYPSNHDFVSVNPHDIKGSFLFYNGNRLTTNMPEVEICIDTTDYLYYKKWYPLLCSLGHSPDITKGAARPNSPGLSCRSGFASRRFYFETPQGDSNRFNRDEFIDVYRDNLCYFNVRNLTSGEYIKGTVIVLDYFLIFSDCPKTS